ncbi:EAL domain-containing protein [Paenibacillus sp. FSL K6-2859]|uniref:EAL domain-containing protein n=1 Tax=Paenibacillus sp. FSL K6-2859 TaxID=2921482 RepID=UPI0030F989EA
MASSKYDQVIVSSLIHLAHSLGLKVVAEGVEHMTELDILSDYQCDEVQGYLFSRPLTVKDFEDLLASEGDFDCNFEDHRTAPDMLDWSGKELHALL